MELRHGTYQHGYRRGCREQCCKRAYNRWSSNRYNLRKRQGLGPQWVPVEEVSERISLLRTAYNHTYKSIAKVTGVDQNTVKRWAHEELPRVKKVGADKVLAIPLRSYTDITRDRGWISAAGSVRRVHAMFLRGFTEIHISKLTGCNEKTIHRVRVGRAEKVYKVTHDKIRNGFNSSLLVGDPVGRYADFTRKKASEEGYLPSGIWENIDDPDCKPDSLLSPAAEDAVVRSRRLHSRGFLLSQIAEESGFHKSNLSKLLLGNKRSLRSDQVKRLARACDTLEPQPDPVGPRHDVARKIARSRGWR